MSILEANPQRSIEAITVRENEISNGIDSLFRVKENNYFEESLDLSKTSDLLRLANEIHPTYLLIAQHIFGNLIALFWSVLKKKGVHGKFDLPGAIDILLNNQADLLVGGYDDKVRNSIAHGQVYFRGLGIQYGEPNNKYELSTYEFFDRFDNLWRVSVSLSLALFLFLARYRGIKELKIPLSINWKLAASYLNRNDFEIKDNVVSELSAKGKQLHVLVETENVSRNAIIIDCLHYAVRLFHLGEISFSRLLFDVNYDNKTISGLLVIDNNKLIHLLRTKAPYERVGEVIEGNLLWYDEPIRLLMVKTFFRNIRSAFKFGYWQFMRQQAGNLKLLPPNTFLIKKSNNSSAGGIARLDIYAVLINPDEASNKEIKVMICKKIIQKFSYHWMATNPSNLGRYANCYSLPKYIWIHLYRRDGTYRWLGSSGWPSGELICLAEYIQGEHLPVLVKVPDIIENGTRFQFSMKVPSTATQYSPNETN